MEHLEKQLPTAQLLEQYRMLLETVETLPLQITGSSMGPFLAPGRDSVLLTKPKRPLRRGDIVLYRRSSGDYILHRICRCCPDGSYCMIGDAQQTVEPGILPEQILAVVCSATRKGRCQGPGHFWWEFFARVWVRVIPLRPRLLRIYTKFKNTGRKFR